MAAGGHCSIQGAFTLVCMSLSLLEDLVEFQNSTVIRGLLWLNAGKCPPAAFEVFNTWPRLERVTTTLTGCCFGCPADRPTGVTFHPEHCACRSWTISPANGTATRPPPTIDEAAVLAGAGGVLFGVVLTVLLFATVAFLRRTYRACHDEHTLLDDRSGADDDDEGDATTAAAAAGPGDTLFTIAGEDDGSGDDI